MIRDPYTGQQLQPLRRIPHSGHALSGPYRPRVPRCAADNITGAVCWAGLLAVLGLNVWEAWFR